MRNLKSEEMVKVGLRKEQAKFEKEDVEEVDREVKEEGRQLKSCDLGI